MYRFPRLQANTMLRLSHHGTETYTYIVFYIGVSQPQRHNKYNSIVKSYLDANEVRRRFCRRWFGPIVTNIAIIKLKYVTEYNTIQYNTIPQ